MVLPLLIAAGLSAASSLAGGITANSAARARAKALQAAAVQARNEAGIAAQLGLEDSARTIGSAITMAASGTGGGGTGSATDVLKDLERQSIFQARSTVYRGETEARNREYDALVAKQEGKDALMKSVLEAGAAAASVMVGGAAGGAGKVGAKLAASGNLKSALTGFMGFSAAKGLASLATAKRGMTTVY